MPEQLKTNTMSPDTLGVYLGGHAFLWSQFVLGWVQQNANCGSSDRRLSPVEPSFGMTMPKKYCPILL